MLNYKFCIAYPDNGTVSVPFMESHIQMVFHELQKPREECLMGSRTHATSCHVPLNRNSICDFFLNKTTDDFLVMVDTDIEFKHTILEDLNKLINEYGIDKNVTYLERELYPHIISGRADISNGLPVFFKKFGEGDYKQDPRPFTGLKKFNAVGTGIVAISRYCLHTILEEMPTESRYHFFNHLPEAGKLSSDDFSFVFLARQYGFTPYGAWNVYGKHHKTMVIQPRYLETEEEYSNYKNSHPGEVPSWMLEEE